MRRTAMIGVLLFGCASCMAEEWVRLESANFEVFTNAGPAIGREAIGRFEQIRHVFEARTRRSNLTPLPVRIYVFRSEADFRPFQIRENAAGYYQAGSDRDYIAMSSSVPDIYRIVFHEYIHLLLRHAGLRVPVWFNEGTAELYSTLHVNGSELRVGDLIPAHISTLRTETPLDPAVLMGVNHESPHYNEKGKSGIFYAQSWALVHMLNFSAEYQPGLANFLEMVFAGEAPARTLQQAFGKTQGDLAQDLANYVRQQRFVGVKARGPKLRQLKKVIATPLDRASADLVLADLLLAIRKEPEAERIYARLAAADPKSPAVQTALGDLALRRNDESLARRYYERAIELGSKSGRLRFDYAMLIRDGGAPDSDVAAQLEEAVRLEPALFDARHLLGYIRLRERQFRQAIDHLSAAADLRPSHSSVWEYLALAYHQTGARDEAIAAAKNARRAATTEEELSRIEATLRLIDQEPETIVRSLPASPYGDPTSPAKSGPKRGEDEISTAQTGERVEGLLVQVDCLGSMARLHVIGGSSKTFLLVRDASSVILKGLSSATTELACGPVKSRSVEIQYRPNPNQTYGTSGEVSVIHFR
jgi:tetratricopeptide (TPR) repeat protein